MIPQKVFLLVFSNRRVCFECIWRNNVCVNANSPRFRLGLLTYILIFQSSLDPLLVLNMVKQLVIDVVLNQGAATCENKEVRVCGIAALIVEDITPFENLVGYSTVCQHEEAHVSFELVSDLVKFCDYFV